jgi:O-succinylbenzoic acid--CoA ligase
MNHWQDDLVLPMRHEAWDGDRIVRAFTPRPASFFTLFDNACIANPQADAIVFEGQRWRYAQARTEALRYAGFFAAQGLRQGDRVILFLGNRPEFLFVLLGAQYLGLITVPVGVREQRPGLAYIANQCEARAIVFDAELTDRIPDTTEAAALQHRWSAEALTTQLPAQADAPPAAMPGEADTACILYTSGTTGNPKGAKLSHRNVAHSVLHYQACMRLQPRDRSALAVPASHVTGLIAIIATMWQVGGAVIVMPAFKADAFLALVERERISHTLMVPAMYKLCLLSENLPRHDLSSWRLGGYGGAPMPVATIDELATHIPSLTLLNAYGATETTSPTTMMPAGLTRAHADSVGVALPAADIRVMDDDGREVPPGETGELWIGGPMVVSGYWNNAQATAASFTAGYWHSGDLGSVDAQGFVRIFDRKKDMLNRGGFKIYSVEVENTLLALPGVVEAAIVGRPCPVLGERVHAFLYAPDVPHNDEAVRQHCRARLADYKVPETITWCKAPLPRNANGKVMKRTLRTQLEASFVS